MASPRIYYLAPDDDRPSWGTGLLYHHVRLLREIGFDACVLHRRKGFRMSWLDTTPEIRYLDARFRPDPSDLLVVPEVLAHFDKVYAFACRRIVFVQGSFLIQTGFDQAVDYRELGYDAAMAVLPHVCEIVGRHCGLTPKLVPPFIAPYFFADDNELMRPRRRRILLVGKPEYRQAGYLDYDIATKILGRLLQSRPEWSLVELTGQTHRETAKTMKDSALLLNLNTLEAFNTTVPEAMAAGCLAICYEAYGGQDFLRPGENAFVWPNNHVYPLLDHLCGLIDRYDQEADQLVAMRRAAIATARSFQEAQTAQALREFFEPLVNG